jgi:glycosyltransferase involved in cell wall biosynthesis
LLWVRAFAEIYNPTLAIEVVKKLQNIGINATLTMVGPDKDGSLEKCKQLAADYNLSVNFTGKLEKNEWIALSKKHDIFINTTNFDNMPVSIIEAMALGLPVISTNVGGMPYLIDDHKTGLLVPPDNSQGFVDSIQHLLENPDLVKSLTKNARMQVEAFDWEKVKNKWLELIP